MNDVTFGIPLISRRVARDWPSCERLLAATLRSVFNQAGASIRVIVACHEAPKIEEIRDSRVIVRPVDFDIPRFRWEMELDRMRKWEVLGSELRSQGGGWMFFLDADDFVSRDLAKTIRQSRAKAVIVRRGYRLDLRTGRYQNFGKLWGKCGSCVAVHWEASELPLTTPADNPPIYHEFCEHRHYLLPQLFSALGWRWQFLEPPLVAYVVNHGSNESEVIVNDTLKWKIYYKLHRWKSWTKELDDEFGVSPDDRAEGIYDGQNLFSTEFREIDFPRSGRRPPLPVWQKWMPTAPPPR